MKFNFNQTSNYTSPYDSSDCVTKFWSALLSRCRWGTPNLPSRAIGRFSQKMSPYKRRKINTSHGNTGTATQANTAQYSLNNIGMVLADQMACGLIPHSYIPPVSSYYYCLWLHQYLLGARQPLHYSPPSPVQLLENIIADI